MSVSSQPQTHLAEIMTAYPRPQLERADWQCLNGSWEFALDAEAKWSRPEQVVFDATIEVPFAPETQASGIANTSFYMACWYRRQLQLPALKAGERLLLHFEAVDYAATVWVNGKLVATHEGGYTPFQADVTDCLDGSPAQTLVVRAEDDPHELGKPRGKQDWQLNPHSIWYPRTTGIWQTVWLERVPASWIGTIRWTPSLERWEIGFEAWLAGNRSDDLRLHVRLHVGETLLADDTYAVIAGEVHRRIALSDPGIDDYRNELLWNPASPTLIRAQIHLYDQSNVLDVVQSYTALRSIAVQGDRFVLNGRPYPLRLVLDQGYWAESGLTAPSDQALRRDVELVKAMGFNGVRKHQKIESRRFLYWADTLGLLVWEEMPSAYRYTKRTIERVTREWTAVVERDVSHPCIIAWVPFNESWGVPDLPDSQAQRHYVQALYHLTKTLDSSRPVIGNDGWESIATDIIGIHDYDDQPQRIAKRYGASDEPTRLFQRERPAGRQLLLSDYPNAGQPIMLTEFGGIAFSADREHTWGYSRCESPEDFSRRYSELLTVIRSLPLLSGFCYTQFTDTYQEANGLLYVDRTPKISIEEIARATRGPRTRRDQELEQAWRERLMDLQRHKYGGAAEDHQVHDDR